MVDILTPPSFTGPDAIEKFYLQFNNALATRIHDSMAFDFRGIPFLTPDEILAVVSAARLWHRETSQSVTLHVQKKVQMYLERMDVFALCSDYLVPGIAVDERWDRSDESRKLLELMPIASQEDENAENVTDALRRAGSILLTWLEDESRADAIRNLFSEVAENIVHREDVGYAIIQRYSDSLTGGSRVHIGISDLGIGIQESLCRQNPGLKEAFQEGSKYILHALNLGVTGGNTIRGVGLANVKKTVAGEKGVLTIRTMRSKIRFQEDGAIIQD